MITGVIALSEYTIAIEYGAGPAFNAFFVGEAKPGTAQTATGWRIKRITYDLNNNATNIEWANGSSAFDKIWASRALYTYS